jgi:hypothetical protein
MAHEASEGIATITSKLNAPGVEPGVDAEPDNPVARACRNLLERGQRFRHLAHTYFRDPSGAMRWFGIFVETDAGNVLFFPGFARSYDHVVGQRGDRRGKFSRALTVDHVTLEADFASWHLTSARSKQHQGVARTRPVGHGTTLWFGMTVARANVLRLVSSETVASAPMPSADARDRLDTLNKARQDAEFPIISMNGASPWGETMHFAVAAGPLSAPPHTGPELALPEGSPHVRQPAFEGHVQLPLRALSFALGPRHRIHVISTWLPVDLSLAVTFTATPNP